MKEGDIDPMVIEFEELELEQPESEEDDYISLLSCNVIREIARNFSLAEVYSMCLTSKRFNKCICDSREFWQKRLEDEFPNATINIDYSPKDNYRALLIEKIHHEGHIGENREFYLRDLYMVNPLAFGALFCILDIHPQYLNSILTKDILRQATRTGDIPILKKYSTLRDLIWNGPASVMFFRGGKSDKSEIPFVLLFMALENGQFGASQFLIEYALEHKNLDFMVKYFEELLNDYISIRAFEERHDTMDGGYVNRYEAAITTLVQVPMFIEVMERAGGIKYYREMLYLSGLQQVGDLLGRIQEARTN